LTGLRPWHLPLLSPSRSELLELFAVFSLELVALTRRLLTMRQLPFEDYRSLFMAPWTEENKVSRGSVQGCSVDVMVNSEAAVDWQRLQETTDMRGLVQVCLGDFWSRVAYTTSSASLTSRIRHSGIVRPELTHQWTQERRSQCLAHSQGALTAALPRSPLLDASAAVKAVTWSQAIAYTQQAQSHVHTRLQMVAHLGLPVYQSPVSPPTYFAPLSSPAANHNLHLRRISASYGTLLNPTPKALHPTPGTLCCICLRRCLYLSQCIS
jgi:hypothetical protein